MRKLDLSKIPRVSLNGKLIMVDGKVIPAVGPDGAVQRNISLAVESLLKKVAASE